MIPTSAGAPFRQHQSPTSPPGTEDTVLDALRQADPEVAAALQAEVSRQEETLVLIASENFASRAVLEATGSIFTNKYAEGYPGRRYYGGCENADTVERLAEAHRPRLIVAGASAYARIIDFPRIRAIADRVGALVMADVAHTAGLIAAGVHPSPVPYAEFVTTTTHKTLRGPRGALILCRERFAKEID